MRAGSSRGINRLAVHWLMLFAAVLAASACTTTRQLGGSDLRPPEGSYRLIVVQPDVTVSVLTAGGALEPQEAWTNQARAHVLEALSTQQALRGGETKVAEKREVTGVDAQTVSDLLELHKAVGASIRLHKYAPHPLPTKANQFDWTLGSEAIAFGKQANYDYALFLHAEDSFASGGRVALQVAGFLTCFVGICAAPAGGQQVAFASLVDLKTGRVVWFNVLSSSVGDIRSPDGAKKMVSSLLDKMKPGKPLQATSKS